MCKKPSMRPGLDKEKFPPTRRKVEEIHPMDIFICSDR